MSEKLTNKKSLILEVEMRDFYADDLDECAAFIAEPDPPDADDRLFVVTEEWMKPDVTVTVCSIPGEKCMSDDFELHAFKARIVGARLGSPS